MNAQECREVLNHFKRSNREFIRDGVFGSIAVVMLDEVFTIVVEKKVDTNLETPDKFSITIGLGGDVPVRYVTDLTFKATSDHKSTETRNLGPIVQAGSRAAAHGSSYEGTAGWTVDLDGIIKCISNWHVLCARGNLTEYGDNGQHCDLDNDYSGLDPRDVATLLDYTTVAGSGNIWDYAEAKYNDQSNPPAIDKCAECFDGSRHIYPSFLTDPSKVVVNTKCQMVGWRSGCTEGTFSGLIDNAALTYEQQNITCSFDQQRLFTKMSDKGDSGAIIALEEDGSAMGLNMGLGGWGGGPVFTIANPLYKAGWIHSGFRILGEKTFPSFVSSEQINDFSMPLVSLPRPNQSKRKPADLPLVKTARSRSYGASTEFPIFTTKFTFLGFGGKWDVPGNQDGLPGTIKKVLLTEQSGETVCLGAPDDPRGSRIRAITAIPYAGVVTGVPNEVIFYGYYGGLGSYTCRFTLCAFDDPSGFFIF